MRNLADRPAGVEVYVMMARLSSRILALVGTGLGIVLLAGGPDRFTARGLATAREVPGAHLTWGAAALVIGLLMYGAGRLHRWRLLELATAALALWCLFFAVSLAWSAWQDAALPAGAPKAGMTGIVTYSGVAMLAIVQYSGLRQGRRLLRWSHP